MTRWSELRHAYGTAENVPTLLATAESSNDWDDAYSHLFHQGTVYSASMAALPLLAEMALRHQPAGFIAPMDLAAAILSSQDTPAPDDLDRARAEHHEQIDALHGLAQRRLQNATTVSDVAYLLQALMAFEDVDPWQRSLNWLADGEAMLECLACDVPLLLDLTEAPGTLALLAEPATTTVATPSDPAPGSTERRLLDLADHHGWSQLMGPMRALFGDARCPRCGAEFDIPAAIV